MDFTLTRRSKVPIKTEYDSLENLYPHNIMMYNLPPTEDIKIEEFEQLALERLKLLRIFEQSTSRNLKFGSDDFKEFVNAEMTREGLKGFLKLCSGNSTKNEAKKESEVQARRRDYISHFILRLAYCRSKDLRRWFIDQELLYFKYKFLALTSSEIKHFLEINRLDYSAISEEEKSEVKDGLYESTYGQNAAKIELTDFYKVHFTEVLDLIKFRKCFIQKGFCYVSSQDFISIISASYAQKMNVGLESCQRILAEIENDDRLCRLLRSLHKSYTGKDYTVAANQVTPESIDQLSNKSFPLCMRMSHEHLRAHHHHKHDGRRQYGLFLKGIGLSLEDALRFWREEFTKKVDNEKFDKQYAYNIRHSYGKEGSMVNYTPLSCLTIINLSYGAGSTHGCPYKIFDTATLKTKMTSYGISQIHIQEIVNYSSKGHYQLACGKYFEVVHEKPLEAGINHPNQYFEQSQIIMGNREVKKPVPNNPRKRLAGKGLNYTMTENDDDDELWQVAEKEESMFSQKTAFEDDLDLTQINEMECN